MKISGFYDESISNGLGWRAVLFVSGCPNNCPECHNKQAQNFNYGEPFNKQEILSKIKGNSILKGITISGGEPLCEQNQKEVLEFIKDVKKVRPEFNVWCYSGYTFEELTKRDNEVTKECLKEIDILVDGRFKKEEKDPTLKFRGSKNQRILDVCKSLTENRIVEFKI